MQEKLEKNSFIPNFYSNFQRKEKQERTSLIYLGNEARNQPSCFVVMILPQNNYTII